MRDIGGEIVVVAPTMNIAVTFCKQVGLPKSCIKNNVESLKGLNNVNVFVENWWQLKENIRKELMMSVRKDGVNVIAVSDYKEENIVIKQISEFDADWEGLK